MNTKTDKNQATDKAENDPKAERRARMRAAMGEAGTDKRKSRRKMVTRLHQMLSSTPDDGTGMVDGTPFSLVGVERLMNVLKQRSEDTSKTGAKAAGRMVDFLSPKKDGEDAVNGASLNKLQWIANMESRFKD